MYRRALHFACLFFVCCSVVFSEAGDSKPGSCSQLCRDFSTFVYETIQKKSLYDGLLSRNQMYSYVKMHVSDFCKGRPGSKKMCKQFVENTWFVVVALESGANTEDICRHLNVCEKKVKETSVGKKMDTKKTFETVVKFCYEVVESPTARTKICAELSAFIHSVMRSIETEMNGGSVMQELTKCSPKGQEIGCRLQKAHPSVKLAVVMVSSMLPSFSKLKKKMQERILKPDLMCLYFDLESTELKSSSNITEHKAMSSIGKRNWQMQCKSTCSFFTKMAFSANLNEYSSSSEFQEKFKNGCQLMNFAKPVKCTKMFEYLKKIKESLSTVITDRFCTRSACNVQAVAELRSKQKQRCQPIAKADFSSPVKAGFKPKTGHSESLGTSTWFTVMMALITVMIAAK